MSGSASIPGRSPSITRAVPARVRWSGATSKPTLTVVSVSRELLVAAQDRLAGGAPGELRRMREAARPQLLAARNRRPERLRPGFGVVRIGAQRRVARGFVERRVRRD